MYEILRIKIAFMIVSLRVDDRLVHGQVALAWSKTLGTQGIIVANDRAASNDIQKMTLKMATPAGQKMTVCTVEKAIDLLKNPKAKNMRLMVIVNTVKDVLEISKNVPEVKEVNLAGAGRLEGGNMEEKTILVKSCVFLRPEEMVALRELVDLKIDVYNQPLPTSPKIKIEDLI